MVSTGTFVMLILGAVASCILPVVIALIWKFTKKEKFTTILLGAAVFLVFALILEKPIQALLISPTQLGLRSTRLAGYLHLRPVLLAVVCGLFPGVFEETGRLVAFKTLLRKRRNRETAISYGIGHGGFEVMMLLGMIYIQNVMYAVMINTGAFDVMISRAEALQPGSGATLYTLKMQLIDITAADVGLAMAERVFAVLFHIGASILVFYACRDKGKFWLYPLAILLHTAMDFFAGLYSLGVLKISDLGVEVSLAVFGILVFGISYAVLYRKDRKSTDAA